MLMTHIKEKLIDKIQVSKDLELLEDILAILNEDTDEILSLTNQQKSSVEKSLRDINTGKVFSEAGFNKKMDQWENK